MDRISSAPYTQIQRISVILGEEQVELITKPGLPKWDIFSPTTNLLIENADIQPGDSILLYGGHLGVLAVYLTRRYPLARIFATDHLHTSLEMTRQTLEVNHVESVYIIEDIEIPA
ncbi:MAG TPA: methyltransferase, partial [Anaerolineales bacterium]|nr:methyltransferase [Anaerolineales bacterium]